MAKAGLGRANQRILDADMVKSSNASVLWSGDDIHSFRHGFSMALIEIDGLPWFTMVYHGLPSYKKLQKYFNMGGSFHGEVWMS